MRPKRFRIIIIYAYRLDFFHMPPRRKSNRSKSPRTGRRIKTPAGKTRSRSQSATVAANRRAQKHRRNSGHRFMRLGGVKTAAADDTTTHVLGVGATACVFRPAIICDGRLLDATKVSKIYRSSMGADRDWKTDQIVARLDPTSLFSVKAHCKCNLPRVFVPPDFFTGKCTVDRRVYDRDLPEYTQIIYDYAGISYGVYMRTSPRLADYIRAVLPLFYGLEYFHARGLTHGDISTGNITFNENKGYFIFIDFGNGNGGDTVTVDTYKTEKEVLLQVVVRSFVYLHSARNYSKFDLYFPLDEQYKESLAAVVLDRRFTYERLYEYARDQFGIVFGPTTGTFVS